MIELSFDDFETGVKHFTDFSRWLDNRRIERKQGTSFSIKYYCKVERQYSTQIEQITRPVTPPYIIHYEFYSIKDEEMFRKHFKICQIAQTKPYKILRNDTTTL